MVGRVGDECEKQDRCTVRLVVGLPHRPCLGHLPDIYGVCSLGWRNFNRWLMLDRSTASSFQGTGESLQHSTSASASHCDKSSEAEYGEEVPGKLSDRPFTDDTKRELQVDEI